MTHALRQEEFAEDVEDVEFDADDLEDEDEAEVVEASFSPEAHPRAPAGSENGGEFAPGGGSGRGKSVAKPKRRARRRTIPKGSLGFDGQSGTGYDHPDDNVKSLQTELNRLGLADSQGRKLRVDGQFGPLTTQSVKEAQRRLGMKPTGIVDPAFIARLKGLKSLPAKTAAAAATPYGPKSEVDYADPGYQSDGKARYPIDTSPHCRSAWSYISMPKNAAMYTAEQLASIKAKIKAAGKKYGIDFADEVKASDALRDVELARPGDWKLASGDVTFTAQMLQDAADFFAASGGQAVPVKLGHTDSRFNGDGEPAFGSVTNVRYHVDDRGPVLLGDIVDMPQWLSAAAPKRWPNRSIEGWRNFSYDGREYSLVLSGLAFLGVTPPGVKNIKSLADLQTALAASSAIRLVASAPVDDDAEPPDELEELDEEEDELDDELDDDEPPEEPPAPIPPSPAPAHPAGVSHVAAQAAARIHNAPVRGAGMDPAKIREALGLTSDASDDEVRAAVVTAGLAPPAAAPAAASQQELDQRLAASAATSGVITIDAAQIAAFQEGMVKAAALQKRLEEQDRDQAITAAVKAGKFPPSRRAHYEHAWDVDPAGTKQLIASLAAGLVPVTASGYDADSADATWDAEYRGLFPPTYNTKGA